jgi:hypothetical protein
MTIIIAILNYLLGVGQYSPEADSYSIRTSISSILNTIVIIIAQLIIARGLLVNRMGTVGEYLDNINYLNFKVFAVCALVQIIPVIAIFVIGTSILGGVAISGAISDGFEGMGFSIVMAILFTVALLIYGLFAFYEYFVAVDNKDLSFGQIFKKIFKVGKDLISDTFKILFVQIILPIIVYIIIVILLISNIKGLSALAIVGLLTIVFSIYIIIVTVKVLARLSDAYLDYKASQNEENDEIVYEE